MPRRWFWLLNNPMQLILTGTTYYPMNAVYADASGAPQYKVNTPLNLLNGRTTAISRVVDGIPRRQSQSGDEHETEGEEGERFASLAHIDWRVVESTVIRFRGRELLTRDFFRKTGWGLYGRHHVFTASDGKEYKWIISTYTTELKSNDAAETPVAHYRPKKFGLLSKTRKASLEVLPEFEHLMDDILVTFVYIEGLRELPADQINI
ncbi:hypothetical protein C8R44DRAFT_790012 [Mycena epipterygia]|nr:hypothetical protein C8R44DRAFT_790012 [Mycena epipterygia]